MFPRLVFAALAGLLAAQNAAALSLLTYNVAGNGTTNWSTNAPQVQAIGRTLAFLQPDVVTFNEIPRTNTWQMANFAAAYLPGYFLATNSGTDGFIRSAVASRHAIVRSKSWLDFASLTPFGATNQNFARDLFEAEIDVPGFAQHLHVFVTHLKAYSDYTNATRRAAEAAAISNFFVTTFLPANGQRPYVLAGDMNEDIARPPSTSGFPLQRLANAATGLRLTTPTNPVTGSERTYSIRASLSERIDYILPCGLLFSNLAFSQVFRSDRLAPPPPGLLTNDSRTASDHLPVLMVFDNPYDRTFRIASVTASNQFLHLLWPATPGRLYRVEASTNLTAWSAASSNLTATATNLGFNLLRRNRAEFLRVLRLP